MREEHDEKFDAWIDELRAVTIEDYGFEDGEFTIFPDLWRALFDEGLTPQDAFARVLDAKAYARREADELARTRAFNDGIVSL